MHVLTQDHPAVPRDGHGEHVFRSGGEAILVLAGQMPTRTGAPALYRF